MKKIKFILYAICSLSVFVTGISYALVKVKPLKMECNESVESAQWFRIAGKPTSKLSLRTLGLEVAGQERLLADRREIETYILGGTEIVHVDAECTPSQGGRPTDMFPNRVSAAGITLTCQKGQGLAIRFVSPNAPDPKKYIYHAQVTVETDDPPIRVEDVQQVRVRIPQPDMGSSAMMGMGMGMGGGSSY